MCVLAACAILVASPCWADVDDEFCENGGPALTGPVSFAHTLEALTDHEALKVVALGSSSTQGYGSTSPEHAYPVQLQEILQHHFRRSEILMINKGVGGDDVEQMAARLEKDVILEHPNLVIWQTGTNAAIRHVPLDIFGAALVDGLRKMQERHFDVILMMPQYAPKFTTSSDFQFYLDAMHQAAAENHVAVFERYNMSKAWSEDPHFAGTPLVTPDGLHQTDTGYHCDAVALGQAIIHLARRNTTAQR